MSHLPMEQRVRARKACSERGKLLLACHSEDTIKNRPPSLRERYALSQWSAGDGRRTTDRERAPEREARLSTLFSIAGDLHWEATLLSP